MWVVFDKVFVLDFCEIDDMMMGCGQLGGESGFNIGWVVVVNFGYDFLLGTIVNCYCLSLLQMS